MSNIFYTGNTGGSTGPHLDFRVYNPQTGKYEDSSQFTSYLTTGDDKPFDFQVTSPFGMRTHPKSGEYKMHDGTDYATEIGTQINVPGKLLSTWNDEGSGGIMSQYSVQTKDGHREFLLLHGSDGNPITGTGALTDYEPADPAGAVDTATPTQRAEAKERALNYKEMSKAELNAEYDKLRGGNDINKAVDEGMRMHRAYFNKP